MVNYLFHTLSDIEPFMNRFGAVRPVAIGNFNGSAKSSRSQQLPEHLYRQSESSGLDDMLYNTERFTGSANTKFLKKKNL